MARCRKRASADSDVLVDQQVAGSLGTIDDRSTDRPLVVRQEAA